MYNHSYIISDSETRRRLHQRTRSRLLEQTSWDAAVASGSTPKEVVFALTSSSRKVVLKTNWRKQRLARRGASRATPGGRLTSTWARRRACCCTSLRGRWAWACSSPPTAWCSRGRRGRRSSCTGASWAGRWGAPWREPPPEETSSAGWWPVAPPRAPPPPAVWGPKGTGWAAEHVWLFCNAKIYR